MTVSLRKMTDRERYQANVEECLRIRGRLVTGWWDSEPIHRAMTVEEKCARDGVKPEGVALGLTLLGNKNYKPSFGAQGKPDTRLTF